MSKKHLLIAALAICLLAGTAVALTIPSLATDSRYVAPGFLVDFNDPANVAKNFDAHNVSSVHNADEQAMQLIFIDDGSGMCDDPYVNLAMPSGVIDVTKYHYMALLIKTDFSDAQGEIRLRSGTTQNNYPCYRYNYSSSTSWQLVIVDLTDLSSVIAYPQGAEISGVLSNLRIDPFNNRCSSGVNFYVKAYGLYSSYSDAETFIYFESEVDNTPVKPDIDYSAYYKGEAYASPANRHRMYWVDYGFNQSYQSKVNSLLAQGYGGIVTNVNFNQQYLKDEKEFELLKNAYLFAKEKDMTLWIYDEYQWPSGSAYGQVLDTNAEWRATGIKHVKISLKSPVGQYRIDKDIDLGIKLATLTVGGQVITLEHGTDGLQFDLSDQYSGACVLDVYALRYTDDHEQDRTDFSTLYHVDTLRPDSVARFIELTHKHYASSFGEDFKMVEAFFTDEPSQGNRDMADYVVWTDGLEDKFKQAYGYDLYLPDLFEGQGETARLTRIHYYSLVASLFKQSYIDQIADWCEQNGVASSGHLLFEENMNDHVETYGGDFMQIIGGMTIPGVDILWVDPDHLLSDCNIGNHLGIRFVASAARNAGKTQVMLEYNPSAVKTEQFTADKMGSSIGGATLSRLFGTTVFNVINPQKDYNQAEINLLNDYVGRLNTMLDGTVEAGDLAVFYPIATVQALHNADDVHSSAAGHNTDAVALQRNYNRFCLDLLQRHVLYTVIDDQSICAATVTADGRLVIGNGSYRTLVLAYAEYISPEAAEKLALFKQAGGTVVFVGNTAEVYKSITPDGGERVTAAMSQLSDCESYSLTVAGTRISKLANNTLKLAKLDGGITSKQVLYGDFMDADHDIAYIANSCAIDGSATLEFTDGYTGAYTVYYPMTGEIVSGSGNSVAIYLPAYCAVLVVREDNNATDDTPFGESGEQTTPEDTTAPAEDPTTEQDTTEDVTEQPGGCKSAVAGAAGTALLACALIGTAVVGKKKED